MGVGAAAITAGGLQLWGTAASAYGSYASGSEKASYYSFLSSQSSEESSLATTAGNAQAGEIEKSASLQEEIMARQETKALGAQRATEGANGIGGSVTAQNLAKSSMESAELDVQAVRYNADTKAQQAQVGAGLAAFNYSQQASAYSMSAANAMSAGRIGAYSDILSGASSLASEWYQSGT